ncbi:MAG: heme ABC exporter ATP-binding protein CcmA [Pseudomonadota bacterium]
MPLTVSSLRIDRSGRTILSGLSLEVAAGEALILRGPNGSGKSTLLRGIAGLLPRTGGTVMCDGIDLDDDPDGFQDLLAYAGHLDAVKPQLTVAENIRFWAGLFGGSAEEALDRFDLGALSDRPTHTCSAGQKRRLGLARLSLTDRPLWLLDEPTVSLDAETVANFAKLVSAQCERGGMALIATHVDLGLPAARIFEMPEPGHAAEPSSDPFLDAGFA